LDIFNGIGSISPTMLGFVRAQGLQHGYTEEQIVGGNVTGDLSQIGGKSPWAHDPVQVDFGSEYRAEYLELLTDQEYSSNDLYGAGGATKTQPKAGFSVAEGYFEFRAPIVQNMPLMEDLTVNGGFRYSAYSSAGDTETYKYGLEWQPIDDIKLRASAQRAVRAPNVLELFTPTNNVLFSGNDPCATSTAGQCASVPHAGQALLACPASQCNNLTGGNSALKPEESDTKSIGIVLTPSFIPNFNAQIDYWNIKVERFVGNVNPLTTLNYCYGSLATAATEAYFCPLVHRNALGQIFGSGYVSALTQNTGFEATDGIDFTFAYFTDLDTFGLADAGSLSFNFTGTLLKSLVTEPLPGLGSYDCEGYFGATCGAPNPAWRHKLRVTWESPWDLSVSLNWRYFGGVSVDANSTDPNLGSGPGTYVGPDAKIGAYNWFDLAATYNLSQNVELMVGVNNILGIDPPGMDTNNTPLPLGNGNTFPGAYDYLGREIFVNATIKL
jgi:outer membrane receptor protein involved in Fe transport